MQIFYPDDAKDADPSMLLVDNLLSHSDISEILSEHYPTDRISQKRRMCVRRIFESQSLAEKIFQQLRPKLESQCLLDWKDDVGSLWTVSGVNPRFRLIAYTQDTDKFDWHNDGVVFLSSSHKSVASLTIYLTTHLEGGGETELRISDWESPFAHFPSKIVPRKGNAMVLNITTHPIHRGNPCSNAAKIILRTDVMAKQS